MARGRKQGVEPPPPANPVVAKEIKILQASA